MTRTPGLLLLAALLALPACDRRVEPFVPGEQPKQPDLSRIFPPELAPPQPMAGAAPPPPPGARRGAPPMGAQAGARTGAGTAEASASGAPIRGEIRIQPALAANAPSGVLFIIARNGAGGGPPLAVKRITPTRFPVEFSIGPDDRMIEGIPFAGPILISAGLDSDGNATSRTPGDLQGRAAQPVEPGTTGLLVVLDEVL